jgi:type VI secretion system secreted protein VgrG
MAIETDLRFTFSVEGISEPLRVLSFEGEEAISELFSFRLTLGAENAAIALESAIGQPAVLTMKTADDARYLHGLVSRFEQAEAGKQLTVYHATLVPRAYRLTLRHDCRIFQDLTIPQIIESVLKSAGFLAFEYRLTLLRKYQPKEYSVQYRETDWAFIIRLMEEEGIFCFFEHTADGHTLVIGDAPFSTPAIAAPDAVPFNPATGLNPVEGVSLFRFAEEMRPGKVTMRDFNFSLPKLSLQVSAEAQRDKDLEIYDYPGEYTLPGEGTARAASRLEDWQVLRETGRGEGGCPRFASGHVFSLEEHQNDAFNRKYLLVRVEHRGAEPVVGESQGTAPPSYSNRFNVIPAETPFRPAERTPKPTMRGVQTAIVVGPSGEEIYTDEFGRVKVQFHWDRQGKFDEKSSCWIRVSQIWAGQAYGALYIPRIGHEVIVDFLEGDPDRPIIVGRVYHATNVTPYPLPGAKTKSTIKSDTSPGSGGSNELRFEDQKGEEEVYLHGQKDWTILIENDKNQVVGRDETLKVGKDRTKRVDANQSESIGINKSIDVGANHTEKIVGDEAVTVGLRSVKKIGTTLDEEVGSDETRSVGGNQKEEISGNVDVSIGQNATLAVKGDKTVNVESNHDISVKGDMSVAVTGTLTELVDDESTLDVANKIVLKSGLGVITVKKDGTVIIDCKDLKITATGEVKIEGTTKLSVKSSGPVNLNGDGPVKITGSTIDLN